MPNTKSTSTPLSASAQLLKDSGDLLPYPTEYRTLVESLQYLSLTRPDIAFSTNKLTQFMQQPKMGHWYALKRVLRYSVHKLSFALLSHTAQHAHKLHSTHISFVVGFPFTLFLKHRHHAQKLIFFKQSQSQAHPDTQEFFVFFLNFSSILRCSKVA
ncbi:hypothetical protein V8G54_018428 [Vigna mungo]|uniref:Uncharacterized protein n=1 Tax=Vigna mungo TaxID=3915 RepID=A0AAQ3N8Q7_VIGMU